MERQIIACRTKPNCTVWWKEAFSSGSHLITRTNIPVLALSPKKTVFYYALNKSKKINISLIFLFTCNYILRLQNAAFIFILFFNISGEVGTCSQGTKVHHCVLCVSWLFLLLSPLLWVCFYDWHIHRHTCRAESNSRWSSKLTVLPPAWRPFPSVFLIPTRNKSLSFRHASTRALQTVG